MKIDYRTGSQQEVQWIKAHLWETLGEWFQDNYIWSELPWSCCGDISGRVCKLNDTVSFIKS